MHEKHAAPRTQEPRTRQQRPPCGRTALSYLARLSFRRTRRVCMSLELYARTSSSTQFISLVGTFACIHVCYRTHASPRVFTSHACAPKVSWKRRGWRLGWIRWHVYGRTQFGSNKSAAHTLNMPKSECHDVSVASEVHLRGCCHT